MYLILLITRESRTSPDEAKNVTLRLCPFRVNSTSNTEIEYFYTHINTFTKLKWGFTASLTVEAAKPGIGLQSHVDSLTALAQKLSQ